MKRMNAKEWRLISAIYLEEIFKRAVSNILMLSAKSKIKCKLNVSSLWCRRSNRPNAFERFFLLPRYFASNTKTIALSFKWIVIKPFKDFQLENGMFMIRQNMPKLFTAVVQLLFTSWRDGFQRRAQINSSNKLSRAWAAE